MRLILDYVTLDQVRLGSVKIGEVKIRLGCVQVNVGLSQSKVKVSLGQIT